MNILLFQCNDLEYILKPDDGHIGLKHVVRKKTVNCECVKVTDKNQQVLTSFEYLKVPAFNSIDKQTNTGIPARGLIKVVLRFNNGYKLKIISYRVSNNSNTVQNTW
jgi:hypothetical protein